MIRQLIIPEQTDETDLTMFYLLCQKAYNSQTKTTEIRVGEFTKGVNGTTDDWTRWTMSIMNRVMSIRGYETLTEDDRSYFQIIEKYTYSKKRDLYATFTDDGYMYAVRMCATFKIDDLKKLIQLKGKYTQRLAQLLLNHKLSGYCQISISDFYDCLEIPATYPTKELKRCIIKPSIQQIESVDLLEYIDVTYQTSFSLKANNIVFSWKCADLETKNTSMENTQKYKPLLNKNFEQNW